MLLIPVYMYYSHDVTVLKELYPHNIEKKEYFPVYQFRKGAPKQWTKLKHISTYAKWAIVLSEDWGFYQHTGIDLVQVKIALDEMFKNKRFRGASTITQQMVKNVFLSQDRTLWRKVHEIILAQKVEKTLSKDRILEAYLNCIEMGPGIFGINKASWHYFNKHPSALNAREAAFIAMLLPSPKRYYSSFKSKKLTKFASNRVNAILIKLRMAQVLSRENYELAKVTRYSWEQSPILPVIEAEVLETEDIIHEELETLPEETPPGLDELPSDEVPQTLEGDGGGDVREIEGADDVREHR